VAQPRQSQKRETFGSSGWIEAFNRETSAEAFSPRDADSLVLDLHFLNLPVSLAADDAQTLRLLLPITGTPRVVRRDGPGLSSATLPFESFMTLSGAPLSALGDLFRHGLVVDDVALQFVRFMWEHMSVLDSDTKFPDWLRYTAAPS
jgi:hypothetical protein